MDYEFDFVPPRFINQDLLDIEIAGVLGTDVFKGSLVSLNDACLAHRVVIVVLRELTQEELNAIAG